MPSSKDECFTSLGKLELLFIEKNSINSFGKKTFEGLVSLRNLNFLILENLFHGIINILNKFIYTFAF